VIQGKLAGMKVVEFLIHQTESQIDKLFAAARAIPADKLDWEASSESRSVRCQLQEVATAINQFWGMYADRKLEWSPEKTELWLTERKSVVELDELEATTRAQFARLSEFARALSDEDLTATIESPMPTPWSMADVLTYPLWNMAYHEGQINFIGALLKAEAKNV